MAFTSVEFTKHALDQISKRQIGSNQILNTLNDPDRTRFERGCLIAERDTTAGNFIRVVYVEKLTANGTVARVITVIRNYPINRRPHPARRRPVPWNHSSGSSMILRSTRST